MQPSPDTARVSAGLAYLCGHLEEIRDTLGDASAPSELLTTLGSGSPEEIATALNTLHAALRGAGDARGIYGHQRELTPVGVHSLEIVYRCPLQRCDGRAADEVDDDQPRCAISGRELVRERLS